MNEHIEQLKKQKEEYDKQLALLEKQEEALKIRVKGLKQLIRLIESNIEQLTGL